MSGISIERRRAERPPVDEEDPMSGSKSSGRANMWRRHAVSAAALAALFGISALPAHAQYYIVSGSVSGFPSNPFPALDPNLALFNAGSNYLQVGVGSGAAGSFSMLAGAHLIAAGLFYGDVQGSGTGTISGAGTLAELTATGNRLQVGNWGSGDLTVSGGAMIDAAGNVDACRAPGASCASVIGHGAGSTATLTVTGSGSEVRTLRPLAIANADVNTLAQDGFNFGTPGGDTHATVNVLAGATLRSDGAYVSNGPVGGAATGTEHTFADVLIDGAGSQWIVSPDRIAGGTANFNASSHPNATSTITVSNGGRLAVDGSTGGVGANLWLGNGGQSTLTIQSGGIIDVGGATGANGSFVGIGWGPAASGHVTVTDAGSQFNLTGTHASMSVGAGNGGSGRLDITSGGTVTVGNFSIGSHATGLVNVNGGTLQMNGTDGRLLIGDGGTGTLNIADGGIVDATLNPANCIGNWCGNAIGFRAGSAATLSIDGAGSELRVVRNIDVASVWVDQYGGTPGGTSAATVSITGGGSLRSSSVNVGPNAGGPNFLGNGLEQSIAHITIDGAGSQWIATPSAVDGGGVGFNLSNHAHAQSFMTLSNGALLQLDSSANGNWSNLTVGNGGEATLSVLSGSHVQVGGATGSNGSGLIVGNGPNGSGLLSVDGAGSTIQVTGANALLQVGTNGGTGTMDVTSAATVSAGSLGVGNWQGTGVMTVQGGAVQLSGTNNRRLNLGEWGTGTLDISGSGIVDGSLAGASCAGIYCGSAIAGRAGSTATLSIDGAGSALQLLQNVDVASVFVDANGGTPGGTSSATIAITRGGALRSNGATTGAGTTWTGFAGKGSEQSITHITIDGAGSQWVMTPDTANNAGVWFGVSNFAGAQSFVTLSNGALLKVDSSANGNWANLTVGNGGQATLSVLSGSHVQLGGATGNNGSNLNIAWGPGSTGAVTVDGAGSSIDLTGSHANMTVGWGSGASGQLEVAQGGTVTVGGLTIGQANAIGVVNVDGSTLQMNGTDGRLMVGWTGTGTLNVTGGGIVDATLNPLACIGAWCGNGVATNAGSTGTLTISGAGSEVRTLRYFSVGVVWVDQYNGTPGASSTGTVNILAGGSLRTENAYLGTGLGGPLNLGTEQSFAHVLIDGPGSQWIVTRNSVDDDPTAFMGIATHANATADVTVSGGGLLRIDGSGGAGPNSGINIGSNGKGTLVLTDAGSRLQTAGLGAFINVGANNSAGDGSFQILAGATAESLFFNVGRNGGRGTLLIDGTGSQLTLSGVNTDAGSPGTGGGNIGRNGGTGSVTVSNGGRLLISDGGMDSRSTNSPGLSVGRDASGHGSLTITGAGSTVEIVSTSLGLPPGTPDNFNPFVAIGRGSPATASGTLTVSDGGKLILTGNAVSTIANASTTQLNIGGRNGEAGTGTATVTGTGSEIIVQGYDAYIGVGRTAGGSGVLNVLDHARVSSTSFVAGVNTTGTVNVDHATIALSGYRTNTTPLVGAGMTIGRGAGGMGTLNLSNGAALTITPSVLAGGLAIGGDRFLSGGTGTVSLSGGSSITIGGSLAGNRLEIGRSGNGTMTLAGASLVDVGALGETRLGQSVGGIASLNVSGGSQLRTGTIAIGGVDDSVAGGTAAASFSGAGTELNADGATGLIGVGLGGVGSLSINDQATLKGTLLAVGIGAGPTYTGVGAVTLNHATVDLSGQANDPDTVEAGAGLYVGGNGGIGAATISGGTKLTITNNANLGANLALGGFPLPGGALGTGALNVSGGSQVTLVANPGQAIARIGHDGTGSATFSGASLLDVSGGDVIIAGQPNSTGSLTVDSGSVVNANYVGVGANHGVAGGNGTLKVNDGGTVNTTTLEIGPTSVLTGDGGIINAAGDVIVKGQIVPGDAPGRITINCNVITYSGSSLVLGIEATATGYLVGELVFGSDSTLDLTNLDIHFNFIGSTDPNAFQATGGFNLDSFLETRSADGTISGLSTTFAPGETWSTVLANSHLSASSDSYLVTPPVLDSSSGSLFVTATPVPEPETWVLWLGGIALMAAWMRRQGAARRKA
jgi:T5SS/PEP-CTERM-associated repeat protein